MLFTKKKIFFNIIISLENFEIYYFQNKFLFLFFFFCFLFFVFSYLEQAVSIVSDGPIKP